MDTKGTNRTNPAAGCTQLPTTREQLTVRVDHGGYVVHPDFAVGHGDGTGIV